MVIPKPSLSPESQNAIREISNLCSNADQAKRILRSYILTSLIKLRVREQLYFLKTCIEENLSTTRIWRTTERLNLQRKQAETLRRTMMKNLRRELYQKISRLTRDLAEKEGAIRRTIRQEDITTLRRQERLELNYARPRLITDQDALQEQIHVDKEKI